MSDNIEENISLDELNEMLNALVVNQTVSEAIDKQKSYDEFAKESFKALKKSYKSVIIANNKTTLGLKKTLLKSEVRNMGFVLLGGNPDYFITFKGLVDETINDLKQEKDILLLIKRAINLLKKANCPDCNLELLNLLHYLFLKNALLLELLSQNIDYSHLASFGVTFSGANKNQDQLEALNSSIDSSIESLGLKKL